MHGERLGDAGISDGNVGERPGASNDLIETGDDSTMDLIEDIRLAASMLVLHFAKRTEDGDWTCFERSELDLGAEPHLTADSPEERSGECSPEMRERYKKVAWLLGRQYQSPIFNEIGRGH